MVRLTATFCLGLGLLGISCAPDGSPRSDSQTNWLRVCQDGDDCGGLACVCGVCTQGCGEPEDCAALSGASCVAAEEAGAAAVCDGHLPLTAGLCLPRCDAGACGTHEYCVAGVCRPLPQTSVSVTVDPAGKHQTLTGFGATLAYAEADVARHPSKAALYQAMFAELGLDVLRLQNRHDYQVGNMEVIGEIIAAATDSLGRQPIVMLTSWSPPGHLKASGTTTCQGDDATCTLVAREDGSFDYEAYGAYWRAALDAYTGAGVEVTYVGIQNNPEFIPPSTTPGDGCRFLPTEGTEAVSIGGALEQIRYPGLDSALEAVFDAISDLPSVPRLVAPETSTPQVTANYLESLDPAQLGALGHHLYGTDPRNIDVAALEALGELARQSGLPFFQTEMEADGLGTALLVHHAMAVGGAAMYLQSVLARPTLSASLNSGTLIGFSADSFAPQDPYHALRHYALHTDPGWVRVQAQADAAELLASAWLSPDGGRATLVLVNAGASTLDVRVTMDGWATPASAESDVSRSVFAGIERSAELGPLPPSGIVRLPAGSIVTVALRQ